MTGRQGRSRAAALGAALVVSLPVVGRGGPPPCAAGALALTAGPILSRHNGEADWFARIAVRNAGPSFCILPGLVALDFADAAAHPIPVRRRVPTGFHPGPMVRPVTLAPGSAATTTIASVGPIGGADGSCRRTATVRLGLADGSMTAPTPFAARLCGEAATPSIDQPPLRPTR